MTPLLDRVTRAYAPLAARYRWTDGAYPPPRIPRPTSVPRLTLFALVGGLFGRRA